MCPQTKKKQKGGKGEDGHKREERDELEQGKEQSRVHEHSDGKREQVDGYGRQEPEVADGAEEMEEEDSENLRKEAKAFLRYKAKENGKGYVIDCMKGGINALKATPEEKEEIRKMYKLALGVDSLDGVDIMEYMQVLEPESLIERLEHRKAASLKGDKKFVKMKGTQMQEEKQV